MPTPEHLTAGAARYLLPPRQGVDVCGECFNFTRGFDRCFACGTTHSQVDTLVPISYSFFLGPLHHSLTVYKRASGLCAERASRELAGILGRFLSIHEDCVARAVGRQGFDLVTTVPSSNRERDELHPLRRLVGESVAVTRGRYERVLRPAQAELVAHRFHPRRFQASRPLEGAAVLLIDDTWTTGASAHGAAAALKSAGAATVAAVVIGRYLNRDWHENERRLRELTGRFDWSVCSLCAESGPAEIPRAGEARCAA
jgi:predicted amidophosphoribosyltransferase